MTPVKRCLCAFMILTHKRVGMFCKRTSMERRMHALWHVETCRTYVFVSVPTGSEHRSTCGTCRYKAAMQEAQVKSRSLAVAMQSLRRKHDQQWQWPPQHASQTLLKSALKQQSPDSPSRQAVVRLQPMTASSILQTKLGAPASILPRPGSALSR